MRALLPLRVDARTMVLNRNTGFTQTAVGLNRQHGYPAAAVISYQHAFAVALQRNMARPRPTRSLLVQQRQLPRPLVHTKCADGTGAILAKVADFVGRVK